ncbi:MAG: nitroreductase family deazaflavin-dependent oxidoreductase [Candidatus Kariarchaeaceae archaeon]
MWYSQSSTAADHEPAEISEEPSFKYHGYSQYTVLKEPHPNILQKIIIWFVRTRFGAWFIAPFIPYVDRFVIKLTGGRRTLASLLTDLPIVFLEYTGVRSGRAYSIPLVGVPSNGNVVVIGSNWGKRNYPGWYHNIRKQPQMQVRHRREVFAVTAHITHGSEREELWQIAVGIYPGFANYASRTDREIPVIKLVPE